MTAVEKRDERALLAGAKGEGWYLTDRATYGGVGPPCPLCDESMALETFRHPVGDAERLFLVCDVCGFANEAKPEVLSNEDEAKLTMLAGLYGGQGCDVCARLMRDFMVLPEDERMEAIKWHVFGSDHLDVYEQEFRAAVGDDECDTCGGTGNWNGWSGDDEYTQEGGCYDCGGTGKRNPT